MSIYKLYITCNVWCSDLVGWSKRIKFKTPSAGGSNELRFVVYGDMGKAPLDPSIEHYIQVSIF
jgi:acid phosphatase type 7